MAPPSSSTLNTFAQYSPAASFVTAELLKFAVLCDTRGNRSGDHRSTIAIAASSYAASGRDTPAEMPPRRSL